MSLIDSNPIPAFARVAFKRHIEIFCAYSIFSPLAKFNATQHKAFASFCEPAFTTEMCLILYCVNNYICAKRYNMHHKKNRKCIHEYGLICA